MSGYRYKELPFLIDDTGKIIGYVDANGIDQLGFLTADAGRGIHVAHDNRYVVHGDSIWENGATASSYTSRNIIMRAMARANHRLTCASYFGHSGDTTAQILAAFPARVSVYAPSYAFVDGSTNDFLAAIPYTTVYANILAMVALAKKTNTQIIWMGNNGALLLGPDQQKLNELLYKLQQTERFFRFFDMSRPWRSYATTGVAATGGMLASTAFDTTHPNAFGAGLAADLLYTDVISQLSMPPARRNSYIRNGSGGSLGAGDVNNFFRNGLFINDTGTISKYAGAFTGSMPFNFDASRSGAGVTLASTFSLVARTDGGQGNWLNCAITNAGALTDLMTLTADAPPMPANVVAGVSLAQLFADFSVSVSSGTVNTLDINLQFMDSGAAVLATASGNLIPLAAEYLLLTSFDGRLATIPMVVPANTALMQLVINVGTSVGATVQVRIGDIDARVIN